LLPPVLFLPPPLFSPSGVYFHFTSLHYYYPSSLPSFAGADANNAYLIIKLVVLSLIPSYNLSPPPPKAGEEGEQKKGGYTVVAGGEVEFRRL
jgi:hypothetical protein